MNTEQNEQMVNVDVCGEAFAGTVLGIAATVIIGGCTWLTVKGVKKLGEVVVDAAWKRAERKVEKRKEKLEQKIANSEPEIVRKKEVELDHDPFRAMAEEAVDRLLKEQNTGR